MPDAIHARLHTAGGKALIVGNHGSLHIRQQGSIVRMPQVLPQSTNKVTDHSSRRITSTYSCLRLHRPLVHTSCMPGMQRSHPGRKPHNARSGELVNLHSKGTTLTVGAIKLINSTLCLLRGREEDGPVSLNSVGSGGPGMSVCVPHCVEMCCLCAAIQTRHANTHAMHCSQHSCIPPPPFPSPHITLSPWSGHHGRRQYQHGQQCQYRRT